MDEHQSPIAEVDRQNILNNPFAINTIQTKVGLAGFQLDGEYKFTLDQVSKFFELDESTIRRYVRDFSEEFKRNGYSILSGKDLEVAKQFLRANSNTDDVDIAKIGRLAVFNFRSFINLGMVIRESERARQLRSLILDIVLDTVTTKSGGDTTYINQRDGHYLVATYKAQNYRTIFTNALADCVDMGKQKFPYYTNKIYKSIFKEHASEYRKLLSLAKNENVRNTMYSEIITTISMYETGLGNRIRKKSEELNRKLTKDEVNDIFDEFASDPMLEPQLESARTYMASRDHGFRAVLHPELKAYIAPIDSADFERFLGEKSAELSEQIQEYQDVFKRLKDK